ncbi:hypothetical protein OS493_036716 [Desmophyllum pertusum]|uniref:Uncharacterized protein n=1 Tax=Desmophyllum pertusum TaxID=174260 RepID=A0A9W9ZLH4_9CNID|nr:hypothetical protein OS493_036716 [Desmophyllum pertusum]
MTSYPFMWGEKILMKKNYMLFLSDMLSWIKNIVCVEDVAVVYAFQWDSNTPSRGVTATALRDVNSFLPEWYVNEMEDYFARVWRQQRRKEEKREMAEVKQREFEELKMKGVRRRIEESWPRTTSSYEPNMRDERSYAIDQGCYSRRESFQNADYKREYSKSDVRRPSASSLLAEEWFDRDQTSTRVHRQQSPPYSHGSRREKTDKTSRYERRYHEDQDQPQERAWSRKSLTDSSPQRFSGRDHPSFCDDRMSQESGVKRMKRDDARRSRHQDSSSSTSREYEYPQWK